MSIESVSFYLLGLILVGIISYIAGTRKQADYVDTLRSCLSGEKLAREKAQRKYSDLYESFLRVNQYNAELMKKLKTYGASYETVGEDMYDMLLQGISRKDIARHFGVSYSTTCYWLRKKQQEKLGDVKIESLF